MYSCVASHPCWLQSTSESVCSKVHDVHSPDCELYSAASSLTHDERITVNGGDQASAQRLQGDHSRRFLQLWAQHHRLRNYKRLKVAELCLNLAKALSGDNALLSKETSSRRKRRRSNRQPSTSTVAKIRNVSLPLGYRSCICGTQECKTAMINYFNNIHDYEWPEKFFPWLYVGIPAQPSIKRLKASTKGSRARAIQTNRDEKLRRHKVYCRHLNISNTNLTSSKNSLVAFPVHFPLMW